MHHIASKTAHTTHHTKIIQKSRKTKEICGLGKKPKHIATALE
jgi:hypothetical protein